MRIVSPLLKKLVYPVLSATGVLRATSSTGLAVVTYHGVRPAGIKSALDGNLISAEGLRRQLRLLKAHYNVISPDEALAWRQGESLPKRAVLVTCDDGLLNCLTDMLPVLREEGLRCLFFVTGASAEDARVMLWYEELLWAILGATPGPFEISAAGLSIQDKLGSREQRQALWWSMVKQLSYLGAAARAAFVAALSTQLRWPSTPKLDDETSPQCRRFGLMTSAELRQLVSAGMTIGAHTMSHPILSQMPEEVAYSEIHESRVRLEMVLGQRVWAFAYPFGDPQSVTPQVLALTQKAGYEAAFLNFGGGLGTHLPPYALPRIHVTSETSPAELEAHVSGLHSRLLRRAGRDAAKWMRNAASS